MYLRKVEKADVVKHAFDQASNKEAKVIETARYLRSLILEAKNKCNDFPFPDTADILVKRQVEAPNTLLKFFKVLYTGSVTKDVDDRVQRYINVAADDCPRGIVKPAKHVCLGLGLKSIVGSRKVIETLNRFGHSISYHTVESSETDLAMSVTARNSSTPNGLDQQPDLGMGMVRGIRETNLWNLLSKYIW